MKILIIDDDLKKLSAVAEALTETEAPIEIDSVEDIKSAMLKLKDNEYDLAIVDIYLPLKKGSVIQKNGGGQLLAELHRKRESYKLPKYIVGLTQISPIEKADFSEIWIVLQYEHDNTTWSNSLKKLVTHINKINIQSNDNIKVAEPLPTLIVEGETDKFYIEKAFEIFAPEVLPNIHIKSQSNGGANWVAAQLIIWGFQLSKDDSGHLIKALALLDSDTAGNKARKDINRILNSSQQQKACKNLQLPAKYAKDILEYYKAGCQIEIEIESLFSLSLLNEADSLGYLEIRNPTFITKPTGWDDFNVGASEYIISQGIEKETLVLVKKVKMQKKLQFLKLIKSKCGKENSKNVFSNFEQLVSDIKSSLL